ncbi:MAG: hypothetical protein Fur0010_12300 [Bdellovibrio sp.]
MLKILISSLIVFALSSITYGAEQFVLVPFFQSKSSQNFVIEKNKFLSIEKTQVQQNFVFNEKEIKKSELIKKASLQKAGISNWKIEKRLVENDYYEVNGSYLGSKGELTHFVEVQKKLNDGSLIQYLISSEEEISHELKKFVLDYKIKWEQK